MKISTSLPLNSIDNNSYILTIGNFDGMHLGHQSVVNHVKAVAKEKSALSSVLTFSNHPAGVIYHSRISLLCTIEHKIKLFEKLGIDHLIIIPFTQEIAEQSAKTFLRTVKESLNFDRLILGNDARIGKNKEGNQEAVRTIANELNFQVDYLPDLSLDGVRISSSRIRDYIQSGQFLLAQEMLGRPFSIYAPITAGAGRGSQIGFPTANIAVDNLCLPPLGVYAVTLKYLGKEYFGVANLGQAPTLRSDHKTIFEVHVFNHSSNLYGENVEVIFNEFLRPEQRFSDVEELKEQIRKDILIAKQIHKID